MSPAPAYTGIVLLVEDEPAIRALIAQALTLEGFRVVEARNGQEALARFDASIDLLVTDIRMPSMDGATLIQQLRLRRHTLPVVAISGVELSGPDEPDVLFLPKPFTRDQLLLAVRAMIPSASR